MRIHRILIVISVFLLLCGILCGCQQSDPPVTYTLQQQSELKDADFRRTAEQAITVYPVLFTHDAMYQSEDGRLYKTVYSTRERTELGTGLHNMSTGYAARTKEGALVLAKTTHDYETHQEWHFDAALYIESGGLMKSLFSIDGKIGNVCTSGDWIYTTVARQLEPYPEEDLFDAVYENDRFVRIHTATGELQELAQASSGDNKVQFYNTFSDGEKVYLLQSTTDKNGNYAVQLVRFEDGKAAQTYELPVLTETDEMVLGRYTNSQLVNGYLLMQYDCGIRLYALGEHSLTACIVPTEVYGRLITYTGDASVSSRYFAMHNGANDTIYVIDTALPRVLAYPLDELLAGNEYLPLYMTADGAAFVICSEQSSVYQINLL